MTRLTRSGGLPPIPGFLFAVEIRSGSALLCSAAFSEVSGIEASAEPKTIREGGRTWGAAQRAGPVSFATLILKRGITDARDAWTWFDLVHHQGALAQRLDATLTMAAPDPDDSRAVLTWTFAAALPVKFKIADLNAATTQIAVEELHLVHEGFHLEQRA